eukprot:m.148068 g.148068  ORF g.148068 m.148068 type:complete len:345 (+) comp10114_c2_seq1:1605-2639(+)
MSMARCTHCSPSPFFERQPKRSTLRRSSRRSSKLATPPLRASSSSSCSRFTPTRRALRTTGTRRQRMTKTKTTTRPMRRRWIFSPRRRTMSRSRAQPTRLESSFSAQNTSALLSSIALRMPLQKMGRSSHAQPARPHRDQAHAIPTLTTRHCSDQRLQAAGRTLGVPEPAPLMHRSLARPRAAHAQAARVRPTSRAARRQAARSPGSSCPADAHLQASHIEAIARGQRLLPQSMSLQSAEHPSALWTKKQAASSRTLLENRLRFPRPRDALHRRAKRHSRKCRSKGMVLTPIWTSTTQRLRPAFAFPGHLGHHRMLRCAKETFAQSEFFQSSQLCPGPLLHLAL